MKRVLPVLALSLLLATPVFAQAPSTMSYQGVLTDNSGGIVPDGAYDLTFKIYDVSVGGVALWTEAQVGVPVTRGGFGVTLGLATPIALSFDRTYYLGVQVFADPELAPRVRLASSPYALSLRLPFSQSVSSATSLFTISNPGAGPAMVADGRLDVGTTTHDGSLRLFRNGSASKVGNLYANTSGGSLDLFDEAGIVTSFFQADANGTGGFLSVFRTTGGSGFEVDGNKSGSGEPKVSVTGSARSAVFDMSLTGNASVALPADAISSAEQLDEPGIAHTNVASTTVPASLGTLASRSITCPAAGYVVVLASVDLQVTHTTGTASNWEIGVSNASGSLPSEQDFQCDLPAALPSGLYDQTMTAHGVFSVGAGVNTFYLLGDKFSGNTATSFDENLTIMYFPTAYGTVDVPAPQSAAAPENDASAGLGRALTAADISAEQAEALRFNQARLQRELDEMRAKFDELQRELAETAAAQARVAAEPRK